MFPHRPLWMAHSPPSGAQQSTGTAPAFPSRTELSSGTKHSRNQNRQRGGNRSTWQHLCSYLQGSAAFSSALRCGRGEQQGREGLLAQGGHGAVRPCEAAGGPHPGRGRGGLGAASETPNPLRRAGEALGCGPSASPPAPHRAAPSFPFLSFPPFPAPPPAGAPSPGPAATGAARERRGRGT